MSSCSCNWCPKKFDTQVQLLKHERIRHNEGSFFPIEIGAVELRSIPVPSQWKLVVREKQVNLDKDEDEDEGVSGKDERRGRIGSAKWVGPSLVGRVSEYEKELMLRFELMKDYHHYEGLSSASSSSSTTTTSSSSSSTALGSAVKKDGLLDGRLDGLRSRLSALGEQLGSLLTSTSTSSCISLKESRRNGSCGKDGTERSEVFPETDRLMQRAEEEQGKIVVADGKDMRGSRKDNKSREDNLLSDVIEKLNDPRNEPSEVKLGAEYGARLSVAAGGGGEEVVVATTTTTTITTTTFGEQRSKFTGGEGEGGFEDKESVKRDERIEREREHYCCSCTSNWPCCCFYYALGKNLLELVSSSSWRELDAHKHSKTETDGIAECNSAATTPDWSLILCQMIRSITQQALPTLTDGQQPAPPRVGQPQWGSDSFIKGAAAGYPGLREALLAVGVGKLEASGVARTERDAREAGQELMEWPREVGELALQVAGGLPAEGGGKAILSLESPDSSAGKGDGTGKGKGEGEQGGGGDKDASASLMADPEEALRVAAGSLRSLPLPLPLPGDEEALESAQAQAEAAQGVAATGANNDAPLIGISFGKEFGEPASGFGIVVDSGAAPGGPPEVREACTVESNSRHEFNPKFIGRRQEQQRQQQQQQFDADHFELACQASLPERAESELEQQLTLGQQPERIKLTGQQCALTGPSADGFAGGSSDKSGPPERDVERQTERAWSSLKLENDVAGRADSPSGGACEEQPEIAESSSAGSSSAVAAAELVLEASGAIEGEDNDNLFGGSKLARVSLVAARSANDNGEEEGAEQGEVSCGDGGGVVVVVGKQVGGSGSVGGGLAGSEPEQQSDTMKERPLEFCAADSPEHSEEPTLHRDKPLRRLELELPNELSELDKQQADILSSRAVGSAHLGPGELGTFSPRGVVGGECLDPRGVTLTAESICSQRRLTNNESDKLCSILGSGAEGKGSGTDGSCSGSQLVSGDAADESGGRNLSAHIPTRADEKPSEDPESRLQVDSASASASEPDKAILADTRFRDSRRNLRSGPPSGLLSQAKGTDNETVGAEGVEGASSSSAFYNNNGDEHEAATTNNKSDEAAAAAAASCRLLEVSAAHLEGTREGKSVRERERAGSGKPRLAANELRALSYSSSHVHPSASSPSSPPPPPSLIGDLTNETPPPFARRVVFCLLSVAASPSHNESSGYLAAATEEPEEPEKQRDPPRGSSIPLKSILKSSSKGRALPLSLLVGDDDELAAFGRSGSSSLIGRESSVRARTDDGSGQSRAANESKRTGRRRSLVRFSDDLVIQADERASGFGEFGIAGMIPEALDNRGQEK